MRIRLILCLIASLLFGYLPTARADLPFILPNKADLAHIRRAVIYTDAGDLYFDLFPDIAPIHVANFKYAADKGAYKDSSFHIYSPDYIIQGGTFPKSLLKVFNYELPPEFSSERHDFGSLGMARRSNMSNPERVSHPTQFHILLGPAPHMDGSYTIFGKLVAGKELLSKLHKNSHIKDIKVFIVN